LHKKGTHVFLVTQHGLLAHNCPVAWGVFATLSIPCGWGSVEGAMIGGLFGLPVLGCGAVLGGIAAGVIAYSMQENKKEYSIKLEDPNVYDFMSKNAKPAEETTTKSKPKSV